jgi:hypothetical protein
MSTADSKEEEAPQTLYALKKKREKMFIMIPNASIP